MAKRHIDKPDSHLWVYDAGDELLVEPALERGGDAQGGDEAAVRNKVLR